MAYRMDELRAKSPKAEIAYRWVAYDRISNNLKRAMVAAEDAKFVDHEGFDWDGIQTAIEKNQKRGRVVAGGSTITQQLAKNLFLTPQRSYVRKAEEAVITVMLETFLPKRRILELYLNVIEWGNGVFGAEAAAREVLRRFGRVAVAGAGRAARCHGAEPALLRAQPERAGPQPQDRDHRRAHAVGGVALEIYAREPISSIDAVMSRRSVTTTSPSPVVHDGRRAPLRANASATRPPGRFTQARRSPRHRVRRLPRASPW